MLSRKATASCRTHLKSSRREVVTLRAASQAGKHEVSEIGTSLLLPVSYVGRYYLRYLTYLELLGSDTRYIKQQLR